MGSKPNRNEKNSHPLEWNGAKIIILMLEPFPLDPGYPSRFAIISRVTATFFNLKALGHAVRFLILSLLLHQNNYVTKINGIFQVPNISVDFFKNSWYKTINQD